MIQFFIKMTAVIAAAYFALRLPQVGGLTGMVQKLSAATGPGGVHYLNILPDFRSNWDAASRKRKDEHVLPVCIIAEIFSQTLASFSSI
jgi:hypothetical protein